MLFLVISTVEDPIEGWIDNFNGPIGLMMASGKGILRITLTDKSIIPDYMAVDISIKSMIVAAWHRSLSMYLHFFNIYMNNVKLLHIITF